MRTLRCSCVGLRRFLSRLVLAAFVCLSVTGGRCRAGTNISVVSSVPALTANIDVAFTNTVMGRVILPGMGTYTDHLDVIAYTAAFDTNFLAAFPTVIDNGIAIRPVEVRESTNAPRKRYYYSIDGVAAYTTTVSIANYPTNWIQTTYGNCPSWLTGAAKTTWFDQRDPARQIPSFSLISTSDVPAWCAVMTNIANSFPSSQTNLSLFQMYSNDIELVGIGVTGGMDIYIHAPTNITAVDLYRTWDLTNAFGWRLCATLDHVFDPMIYASDASGSMANYMAGNAGVDSDGDGISDLRETLVLGTDPTLRDTVGDGLGDFARVMTYGLPSDKIDSDGDGLSDAYEIANGLNPLSADTDGDGLSDYDEVVTYFGYTSATNYDTDADGLNDYVEVISNKTYAAPYNSSTNCAADTDNDGLSDTSEVNTYHTNPRLVDTDGDGMSDSFEIAYGLNPLNASDATQDPDNDGFNNLVEYEWNMNPNASNSYPSSFYMVSRGPGSNEMPRVKSAPHYVLAMGDLGVYSSLVRVPPRRFGTAMCERRLFHQGTTGFRINGTPAQSVPSPIVIPATATAAVFKITADPGYAGSNIQFDLKDSNNVNHATLVVSSPKVTHAEFHAFGGGFVDVNYGSQGALWYPMPANPPDCRLHVWPVTTPSATYTSTRDLYRTDWILVNTNSSGVSSSCTTLNELDWRSAYVNQSSPPRTRGLQLSPGVYTVQVGIDANANSILETNEVHTSCKVYVPKIDLAVDSDNDGAIAANDSVVEDVLPGKVIWADKDLYWRTGTNDSDVAEMKINFDMGGQVVPQGCYLVLQWFGNTNTTDNIVDIFLDSTCTSPLARTGWHPVYSNACRIGHLFDVGDTVPGSVYLRASTNALCPSGTSKYLTYLATTLKLFCYRLDTKTSVSTNQVRVSVADRPAVTPKNDIFYTWIEEVTSPERYSYIKQVWEAVSNDMTSAGIHCAPYNHTFFRSTFNTCTPSNFLKLAEAGILVTSMHGPQGGGSVLPMAFAHNDAGWSNAVVWANQLGTPYASATDEYGTNQWYVQVDTPFFTTAWKPQRDANSSILLASTCYSATGSPTYISSAGGAFCCGSTTAMLIGGDKMEDGERLYQSMMSKMRYSPWRTAYGAFAQTCTNTTYKTVGHGRVTLWPALLNANQTSSTVFPGSFIGSTGAITALFDTALKEQSGALIKISTPAIRIRNADLRWILSNGNRCGLSWPYTGDLQDSVTNTFRIVSERCVAEPWNSGTLPKKFAGDGGASCGKNYDWGF